MNRLFFSLIFIAVFIYTATAAVNQYRGTFTGDGSGLTNITVPTNTKNWSLYPTNVLGDMQILVAGTNITIVTNGSLRTISASSSGLVTNDFTITAGLSTNLFQFGTQYLTNWSQINTGGVVPIVVSHASHATNADSGWPVQWSMSSITNSDWVTDAVTNGLASTNWVINGFYPLSNPSNYVSSGSSLSLSELSVETLIVSNSVNVTLLQAETLIVTNPVLLNLILSTNYAGINVVGAVAIATEATNALNVSSGITNAWQTYAQGVTNGYPWTNIVMQQAVHATNADNSTTATNAPDGYGVASVNYVLSQFSSVGLTMYASGTTNTGALAGKTNNWQGTATVPVTATTNTLSSLTSGAYIRSTVSTQTFTTVQAGPVSVSSYFMVGGSGSPSTITLAPELYLYDTVSNTLFFEFPSAVAQLITTADATPTLHQWSISTTSVIHTNPFKFVVEWKVSGTAPNATRTLAFVNGGSYDSHTSWAQNLAGARVSFADSAGTVGSIATNVLTSAQVTNVLPAILTNYVGGVNNVNGSVTASNGVFGGGGTGTLGMNIGSGVLVVTNGNVGIGTTSPPEKLTVIGNQTLSGTLSVSNDVTLVGAASDLVVGGIITGNGSGITNISQTAIAPPPYGMVLIPAGTFLMGDSVDGLADAATNSPYVSAFYMDTHDVTFALWKQVYYWATNHSYGFAYVGSGKAVNHPVQTVDWYDCVKWCNARSQQAGKTPVYYTDAGLTAIYTNGEVTVYPKWTVAGYRLPTEAEWEKAARGGLSGQRFPWGNLLISQLMANYLGVTGTYAYDLGPDGYNAIGNYPTTSPGTSPVDAFPPNGYGLYDMAGNVFQWCWDWYGTPYAGGTDPRGPSSGSYRVHRGGGWDIVAYDCRAASRDYNVPSRSNGNLGFRSVLPPGQP